MINLTIIEKTEPNPQWFDMLKAYASAVDSGQDTLLRSLFTRSLLRVQEMADKSILACTIRLEVDDATEGIRLYQSVKDIVSVKDGAGKDLQYSRKGNTIYVFSDQAEVVYTTEPHPDAVEELLPVAYQYATALYDGQDSRSLANILKQCH